MDEIERKPPRMPLSDQIRIAGEMAHPSIRGFAAMMLDEWQPEAVRLEQQLAKAVAGTPEERIADVLHSIGFGAERHDLARRMLKLAQDANGGALEDVEPLRAHKGS